MASEDDDGGLFDLDTVRSLHKTVIALRRALERSRAELETVKKSCLAMGDQKVYKFFVMICLILYLLYYFYTY